MRKQKLTINGFIKSDGSFICLKPQQHVNYLIKHKQFATDYIKLSESCCGGYIFYEAYYDDKMKPTQFQIDTLFDWAKKFNRINEYNNFIEKFD
jgi:hypothetical protein